MHMALNDTVTVGKKQRRLDSRFVWCNPSSKPEEFGNLADAYLF